MCLLNLKETKHFLISVQQNNIQDDQKFSVHLMITIYNVTSNVQSVPRQSPDIY